MRPHPESNQDEEEKDVSINPVYLLSQEPYVGKCKISETILRLETYAIILKI